MALYYSGRIVVPSTSKTSLHDRFTKMMKNRPTSLVSRKFFYSIRMLNRNNIFNVFYENLLNFQGVTSGSSRPGSEKNRRLAAKMESSEHVQV